jgi:hypothetical protein
MRPPTIPENRARSHARATTPWRRGAHAALCGILLASAPAAGQEADSVWLASKGFFQRGEDAVLFLDKASIRALRRGNVSELLRDVPRVEIRQTVSGERLAVLHEDPEWRQHPDDDAGCVLSVYLNGGLVRRGGARGTGLAVDRAVRVRSLTGLELHGAESTPAGDLQSCGSLLLWSFDLTRTVDEEFTGRLRGRAMWSPGGQPAGGIDIALEPAGLRQKTDSGGWFELGALIPGRYRITATTPTGETWSDEMLIRAFAISMIEIEVERRE